jgi:hypothetical protein
MDRLGIGLWQVIAETSTNRDKQADRSDKGQQREQANISHSTSPLPSKTNTKLKNAAGQESRRHAQI